jgi:hypothetical protein
MGTSRRFFAASLVVIGLSSCQTASDAPSASEIGDGLLTVTDLGTQWRETQRDVFDVREVENPVLDPGAFCPESNLDTTELTDLAGQSGADVEFQQKDGASAIRLQAWSNSDAAGFTDVVLVAVATCEGAEWNDEFGTNNTFDVVEGPEVGDAAIHWTTTNQPSGAMADKMSSVGRTSVIRFGDVVLVLQWGVFGDDGIDPVRWAEVVRRAFEMLDDSL